jgi:hypothetical protein
VRSPERERGRSRSRRPRVILKGKGKGKGKDPRGKSSGKGKAKSKPVDDANMLSDPVMNFHDSLIEAVPQAERRATSWKDEFLNFFNLTGDDRRNFAERLFMQLDDLGKLKNKRIYIGPGRDGSSDDKIPIDLKFAPNNTKVAFNKTWKDQGYRKTSFGLFEDVDSEQWKIIEEQESIDAVVDLRSLGDEFKRAKPTKLIVILHPESRHPKGLREEDENPVALLALNPEFDFFEEQDHECFYCGEDTGKKGCSTCGQSKAVSLSLLARAILQTIKK